MSGKTLISRRAIILGAMAAMQFARPAKAHSMLAMPGDPPAGGGAMKDPLAGRFGGPFTLTAQDGRRMSDTDFRGRFMLVYFGYTNCEDVCPLDLAAIGQAVDMIGPAGDLIQPLFVTVDPARDTAAVLAGYVPNFHKRLIGLTGSEPEIAAVAKAYKVHRHKLLPADGHDDRYIVDHGSLSYLMGPDGSFRTLVPHGVAAEAMAATLKKYLPQV